MSVYELLADSVLAVHVGYFLFVVVGQLLILAGWLRGWEWTRCPAFRITHFLAIAIVAVEEAICMQCPLTTLEYYLRALAGQEDVNRDISFVARLLQFVIVRPGWPPLVFTLANVGWGMIVLATLIFYPPRWSSQLDKTLSPTS